MFNRNCMRPATFMNMPNQEGFIDIDNNSGNVDINFAQVQTNDINYDMMDTMETSPIVEPMRERVVHKTIEHIVPHVCPVRTRVINHHVYKHTYQPNYTCCEENVCEHVQCGSCCNF